MKTCAFHVSLELLEKTIVVVSIRVHKDKAQLRTTMFGRSNIRGGGGEHFGGVPRICPCFATCPPDHQRVL